MKFSYSSELRCRTEVLDAEIRAANRYAKGNEIDPVKIVRVAP